MSYHPGRVSNTALHIARHGGAAPWEWLRGSNTGLNFDLDVTSNYHETLCAHLLHAVHGINTTLMLWGDQHWLTSVANGDVFHLIDRCVAFLRSPERDASLMAPSKIFKMVFLSQSFDCGTGERHDIVRRELLSSETGALRNMLPTSDSRSIVIIKIAMLINEFETVISVILPPPYDNCSWDAHAYLRSADEAVFQTNALKAVVLHCGSAEPPHGEVRATVQRLQQRVNAPVPNTQAAMHLLSVLRAQCERPPPAPGHTDWGKQRADELMADLQALEGELVTTRAAFIAANQRAQQLEQALRGGHPDVARPLLLDPVSLQRQVLSVSEQQLSLLNREYMALEARISAIERDVNVPGDVKLKQVLKWRQEESQMLLLRLMEAPRTIIHGGIVAPQGTRLDPSHPAAQILNAKLDPTQDAIAPRPRHTAEGNDAFSPGTGASTSLATRRDGPADARDHVTMGASASGVDPVARFYQDRLTVVENEMAKMADVDVKACIDDYFVRELDRVERELVSWITRCRSAEEQRRVFERALQRAS